MIWRNSGGFLVGLALLLAPTMIAAEPVEPSTFSPPLVLELATEFDGPERFLTLDRVLTVLGDRDEVWPSLRDTVIRVRKGGFVRRSDVERRLVRAGLSADRFAVRGPAFCLCPLPPVTASTGGTSR